jgi:hypothetical protein
MASADSMNDVAHAEEIVTSTDSTAASPSSPAGTGAAVAVSPALASAANTSVAPPPSVPNGIAAAATPAPSSSAAAAPASATAASANGASSSSSNVSGWNGVPLPVSDQVAAQLLSTLHPLMNSNSLIELLEGLETLIVYTRNLILYPDEKKYERHTPLGGYSSARRSERSTPPFKFESDG